MRDVIGCLELAALNSELAASYLKDAEEEFAAVVEKLEECLKLMNGLRQGGTLTDSEDPGAIPDVDGN